MAHFCAAATGPTGPLPWSIIPPPLTDANTGEVLMLGYMNGEALQRTIATGEAHYWSRSRQ